MLEWFVMVALLYLCFFASEKAERKTSKSFFLISGMLILSLFSIFRFDVGWDYPAYWTIVVPHWSGMVFFGDSLKTILFSEYIFETGFSRFNRLEVIPRLIYLISDCLGSPAYIFIIFGVFTYYLIFKTIYKYARDPFVALFAYLAFAYLASLGSIRQALAIALVFYSLWFVFNKQIPGFVICIFLASLTHKSSACMIFLYPLYHFIPMKIELIGLCSLYVIKQIASAFFLRFIKQYAHYMDADLAGGSFMPFVYLLLFLFLCYAVKKFSLRRDKEENVALLKICLAGIALSFIFGGHIGSRISEYFNIFQILLFSNALFAYFCIYPRRKYLFCFLCCLYFFFSIFWASRNGIKAPYTPYRCIFFTDTDEWKDGTPMQLLR